MDFRELIAMLAEQADNYRNYFPDQGDGNQIVQSMTAAEYAARSGGFSCSVHLTADGKISDANTAVHISFTIRPAVPLPA